jgi:putative phosphoesterase
LLRGAAHIIHGGDIGKPEILEELRAVAPLTAVRGNNDRERWAMRLPQTAVLRVEQVVIYVLHNLAELDIDPAGKYNVVVSGHSHQPSVGETDRVLYVNPGSAGPRRFTLPVALGELKISGTRVRARIRQLET